MKKTEILNTLKLLHKKTIDIADGIELLINEIEENLVDKNSSMTNSSINASIKDLNNNELIDKTLDENSSISSSMNGIDIKSTKLVYHEHPQPNQTIIVSKSDPNTSISSI